MIETEAPITEATTEATLKKFKKDVISNERKAKMTGSDGCHFRLKNLSEEKKVQFSTLFFVVLFSPTRKKYVWTDGTFEKKVCKRTARKTLRT